MRFGIHFGSISCGVSGLRKCQHHISSHDLEITNRMEAVGIAGLVNNENFFQLLFFKSVYISDATFRQLTKIFC